MRRFLLVILLFTSLSGQSQVIGGKAAFDFLNIPANAHLSALARYNVSVVGRDPYLSLGNPALLNKKMSGVISASFMPYVGDISFYSIAGAYDFKKAGPFSLSVNYFNYGKLQERLEDGTYVADYYSSDYAVTLGKSYTIGVITLGGNFKFLSSQIGSYNARGWAVDAGALFKHPAEDLTFGLAVKNLGKVYNKHTVTSEDSLPFNVQLGLTYKPRNAPLRFSVTGHHLNKWDIVYNDPNQTTKVDENGKPIVKKVKNAERVIRHLVFALEFFPTKFLDIRFGYNYLMSRELSLTEGPSTSGISIGGAVRWEFLEAAYTHTIVQKAGGLNTFTLNINFSEAGKRAFR